ncbi:hypothetical protein L2K20_01155 [Mycobacterium sp. MBM]|nr:hypothetical protein [Mycobacterium sp. MBM]
MIADTAAIGAARAGLAHRAAEFDVIATALPGATEACVGVLGPVGADFLAALSAALADTAHAVSGLGADLAGAGHTAAATAAAYTDAEHRADRRVTTLGG